MTLTNPNIKVIKYAVIALLLLFIIHRVYQCTHLVNNPVVTDKNEQVIKKAKLNDSLSYHVQTILLAQTQAQVKLLETKLQEELFRKIEIGKKITSIEFRDSIVYVKVPGTPIPVDRSDYNEIYVKFPLRFKHQSAFLSEEYTVHSSDSATIDNLKILSKPHIVIGETGKWFQKKTIKIGIMNENPYILLDSLRSVVYSPKVSKFSLIVGPTVYYDFKSKTPKAQIGITFGYRIF
jgi:hypothetical protein